MTERKLLAAMNPSWRHRLVRRIEQTASKLNRVAYRLDDQRRAPVNDGPLGVTTYPGRRFVLKANRSD